MMEITLTHESERLVEARIASGQYTSAIEVVRDALTLLDQRDRERISELADFHQEIDSIRESLDRGEFVEPEEAMARFARRSEERRQNAA